MLDEFDKSGLSMAEFARRRGLKPDRLRKWRSRFRDEAEGIAGPRLVELVVRGPAPSARLQVRCPSGHTIELVDVALLDGLRAALTAVEEVARC